MRNTSFEYLDRQQHCASSPFPGMESCSMMLEKPWFEEGQFEKTLVDRLFDGFVCSLSLSLSLNKNKKIKNSSFGVVSFDWSFLPVQQR